MAARDGVGDLPKFTDVEGAEIYQISRAAFRQRLRRPRAVMRGLMAERCGLVRAAHPYRCDRLVRASIDLGILDRNDPHWARHAGVTLLIETTTIQAAAQELNLAVAVSEVYQSDPDVAAPAIIWLRLATAMPTLLGQS